MDPQFTKTSGHLDPQSWTVISGLQHALLEMRMSQGCMGSVLKGY